jgi:hypothetical protein
MTAARAITCPACGGSIDIKAAGYSVTVACQYCGSLLDVTNPDVQLITQYHQAAGQSELPLGGRGTLFGVEWETIGYLDRSDSEAAWTEFLLFNPYTGYRWLVFAEEEWQFGTALEERPALRASERVHWREQTYQRDYAPITTKTDRVVGEFYWRVEAGDQVMGCTFSSNGEDRLSLERSRSEINWTLLEPVPDAVVREAFGLAPRPQPGMAEQFVRDFGRARPMARNDLSIMFIMACATAVIVLLIMAIVGFNKTEIPGTGTVAVEGATGDVSIGTITATRPYQFVTVTVRSDDFVNRWVDLDYSLVDRKTQQSIDASSTVEYYAGRDSDGNWAEGSHETRTLFAGVPRGTYDLVVETAAHQWSDGTYYNPASEGETIKLWFEARVGGMSWGNYALLMALLFAVPIIILWWRSER